MVFPGDYNMEFFKKGLKASQNEHTSPHNGELISPQISVSSQISNDILAPVNKDTSTQSLKLTSQSIDRNISSNCQTPPPQYYIVAYPTSDPSCKMYSCFNHSRCPLAGGFPIYLHDFNTYTPVLKDYTISSIREVLNVNNLITILKEKACIYFVLIGEAKHKGRDTSMFNSHKSTNKTANNTLPEFGQTGRNYVVCNMARSVFSEKVGDAILAQSTFTHNQYRPDYDVIIPPALGPSHGDVWAHIPPITQAKRKRLLSFQGEAMKKSKKKMNVIIDVLKRMANYNPKKYIIHVYCKRVDKNIELTTEDWALCKNRKGRRQILQESTFALIIISTDSAYISSTAIQTRLYEALESGAIPVILGGDRIHLPYEEVLDWRRAVISVPIIRVTELKYLLKTISHEDILAFRRQGRLFWERYFISVQAILDSLLATIRSRLNISPKTASSLIHQYSRWNSKLNKTKNTSKISIKSYNRNITVGLFNGYDQWNAWGDPFTLHPHLPWEPLITPESRFIDASIAKQFGKNCMDLSGDHPTEQFTIVIFTYEKATLLLHAFKRLSDIPFLNKILVVISNEFKSSTDELSQYGVPVIMVRAPKNSPNNRYLPYDLIDTEAVLCLDDDFILTQKEITHAFKIWREHRDQIVGFYGRNYALDKSNIFKYHTGYKMKNNSSALCGVSMVLPAAAFIHRYYLWAYWRLLPQPIRSFVDTHMNCEDIAINFLVSHIARKPPVLIEPINPEVYNSSKTPHRHLTDHNKYYEEKHKCLQFFTKIMGYNPLLTTHHNVKVFSNKP